MSWRRMLKMYLLIFWLKCLYSDKVHHDPGESDELDVSIPS